MKVKYGNSRYVIDLKKLTEGYKPIINGEEQKIIVAKEIENTAKLKTEEQEDVNVYFTKDSKCVYVCLDGKYFTFNIVDDDENFSLENESYKDIEYIYPPMPGCVVKILVQAGDSVEEGAALIVVEAMKMEMMLYSTITGVIKQVNVKEKDSVSTDTLLLIVTKEK